MKKVIAIFAIAALAACGGASTEAKTDTAVATVDTAAAATVDTAAAASFPIILGRIFYLPLGLIKRMNVSFQT
ncbi:MAG: hypothetical protein NTY43_07385 [Bacteroidetes bacterium]|nr:hypothetical protein [Bacteroidota bacterium]